MRAGAEALEATYHVVWTMQALAQSAPASHAFLPTVTLEPVADDPIGWGAALPMAGGAQIYTSFPPLGFIAPWLLLSAVGAPLDAVALAHLNTLFGLIAAMGFGLLCASVYREVSSARQPGRLAPSSPREGGAVPLVLAVGGCGYLLLVESLHSHGAVYWPHSLSQIALIFAVWLTLRQLRRPSAVNLLALLGLCALYPALEWTGYVFNAGLVLAFAMAAAWDRQPERIVPRPGACLAGLVSRPSILVMLVTAAVGLFTFAHFSIVLGSEAFLDTSLSRADMRSGGLRLLLALGLGYLLSVGLLLPLGFIALFFVGRTRDDRWLWLVIFVASFPLLENLILLNHAWHFSFDRLKVAVPLGVVLAAALAARAGRLRVLPLSLLAVAVVASNLGLFWQRSVARPDWPAMDTRNQEIARQVRAHPDAGCAVYGNSRHTRGYLNQLFGKDIAEFASVEGLKAHAAKRGACMLVLIRSTYPLADLPRLEAVELYDTDGRQLERIAAP